MHDLADRIRSHSTLGEERFQAFDDRERVVFGARHDFLPK